MCAERRREGPLILTKLRWVMVLPAAVGLTAVVAMIVSLATYPIHRYFPGMDLGIMQLMNVLGSYTFVRGGVVVAPGRKVPIAGMLAVVWILVAISFLVASLLQQENVALATLSLFSAAIGVVAATLMVTRAHSEPESVTAKGAMAVAQILLMIYVLPLIYQVPYQNWRFARENGFLRWVLFGEVVATAKALVWPISLFRAAAESHERESIEKP